MHNLAYLGILLLPLLLVDKFLVEDPCYKLLMYVTTVLVAVASMVGAIYHVKRGG